MRWSVVERRVEWAAAVVFALVIAAVVILNVRPVAAFSDSFAGATNIASLPYSGSGDSTGATSEFNEPQGSCAVNAPADSVWWTYTTPFDEIVTIDTAGSGIDTVLVAYRASANAISLLTEVGCDDDGSDAGLASKLSFAAEAGRTYKFQVHSYNNTPGFVAIDVSAVPANDDLADATTLFGGTVPVNNIGATAEIGEPTPSCARNGDAPDTSVWWRLSGGQGVYEVDTLGSSVDTILSVYQSDTSSPTFGDLTEVACNDDAHGGGGSSAVFAARGFNSYFLRIDGYSGDVGDFDLHFNPMDCLTTIYVDHSATGNDNGADWGDAFANLHDALAMADRCSGATIQIADGVYPVNESGAARTRSFNVPESTTIVAPYPAGGGALPDPTSTVRLSGDLNGDDGSFAGADSENAHRVVSITDGSAVSISGVTVADGRSGAAPFDRGSGFHIEKSTDLFDVVIEDNDGVALHQIAGGLELRGGEVRDNDGIGLLLEANADVFFTSVRDNGIGVEIAPGADADIRNTVAEGNDTAFVARGTTDLVNSLIRDNTVGLDVLAAAGDIVEVINATVVENSSNSFNTAPSGTATIENSILWGNDSPTVGMVSLEISDSVIENSGGSNAWSLPGGVVDGGGNLDVDPVFTNPAAENFRLTPGSPALDIGNPQAIPFDLPDLDEDGNTNLERAPDLDLTDRIKESIPDAGAYERNQPVCSSPVYVDKDQLGPDDGSTWALAFPNLQDGIARAQDCGTAVTEIWIADGTYTPSNADRTVSFDLPDGVTLIGGFDGTEILAIDRDLATPPTILSGDLNGDDTADGLNRSDNSFQVTSVASGITSIIRDLVISDGNANGAIDIGGGMTIDTGADFTASRVTFQNNTSDRQGGAIFAAGSTMIVEDSVFDSNQSSFGGAIYVTTDIEVVNSQFTENSALLDGGALWGFDFSVYGGSFVLNEAVRDGGAILGVTEHLIDGVIFEGNESGGFGGGLYSQGPLTLVNSRLSSNDADSGGGGIYVRGGDIISSSIADNTSDQVAGGLLVDGGGTATELVNSIVWGNGAPSSPNIAQAGMLTIDHSDVQGSGGSGAGWNASLGTDGGANLDVDPVLDVGYVAGASALEDAGRSEPLFGRLDLGDRDHDGLTLEMTPDLLGFSRIQGSATDIGPHEKRADDLKLLSSPCAVFDSTQATGALGGQVVPGETRTVQVTGALAGQGGSSDCAIPATASSAVFTVTAIDGSANGNLRLFPSGDAPAGGVVNYAANGLNNTNTVIVPLSGDGRVDLQSNNSAADVRLVVAGYFGPDGNSALIPLTPCAVSDSRPAQGPTGGFVGPHAPGAAVPDIDVVQTFPVGQGGGNTDCGVPSVATAVLVNVVSVASSGGTGGLALGAGGTSPSEATTRFAPIGLNNAATALVPVDANGRIAVDVLSDTGTPTTHLRLVVLGFTVPAVDVNPAFSPTVPCAVFDTRPGNGAAGSLLGKRASDSTTTYQVTGTPVDQGGVTTGCGVPEGAQAVLINLVAIQGSVAGNLRVYGAGSTPTGGVLNFAELMPQMNNSNAVIVPLDEAGQLSVDVNTASTLSEAVHIRGVVLGYMN